MKIIVLYNEFSSFGGEDKVVNDMISLLKGAGHDVIFRTRSNKDLDIFGKIRAFFGGIFNVFSYREISRLIREQNPDVVHVHNLYSFFSPSVLVACRRSHVPVVMTLHNFALTCPHWSHFRNGRICERCSTGSTYWCLAKNCQENFVESLGYALRSDVARRFRLFQDSVSVFIALTDFAKEKLVRAGYPGDRFAVFPNPVEIGDDRATVSDGEYVGYAGRISEEKGIETFVSAARSLPKIPFKIAGDGPLMAELKASAPGNVSFLGRLDRSDLAGFYRRTRVLVVPSTCFEMCPTVLLEGMSMALPVVASRTGGLPEFISDGETGLLFDPGNSSDMAEKIIRIWEDPDLSVKLGEAARCWTQRECSETTYLNRLLATYRTVIVQPVDVQRPFNLPPQRQ